MGTWFLTLQWALTPQRPGQGSWHLRLMHALSEGQSELTTHSGRQLGGDPIISGRQEHWHCPPIFLGGLEFGPHGFGTHGSRITGGRAATCEDEGDLIHKSSSITELCSKVLYLTRFMHDILSEGKWL